MMDLGLKIGAVFSLAPEETPVTSADETPNGAADTGDAEEYTEMTADDSEGPVNSLDVTGNEHDYVITGADPEMNSSTEVNDLEIDVEGDMSTDTAFSPDVSPDHPPILPMEESVGILSSVYHDEMVEGMPPPVLSPMIDEVPKKLAPTLKREPVEYEAEYIWTLGKERSVVTTGDNKPPAPTEAKKKCTKIYPCYIVLTDISPLIGESLSASFRFIRSLKKTECSNMCKKMYFRRRLKAGKNVFNVKTPSFISKRLKDFEKVDEPCVTPKSTSEYTKLKYPEHESQVPESTLYPSMFMTKTGVKYAFDKVVEEKKSKFSEIRRRLIRREKDLIKQQIKKEKQELKAKQEIESKKLIEEAEEEKIQFDRQTELKTQHIILAEQIKIKREENFHKKAMRKKKQEMPYLKTGVSARSGRVIKPNPLFTDNDFALNGADIEGYRKLSALHRKQRKVLAAVKHMQNRAKRVNRVPVVGGLGAKLDNIFQSVIDCKTKNANTTSNADLEIDNPDKEDGVRDFDLFDSKPKKKKLVKKYDGISYEPVKKKSRNVKRIDKEDGVIIGTMPNTENLMKLFQGDNTVPVHGLDINKGHSVDTGTQNISSAYPFAKSLLNASKPVEQKQDKMSDSMKGAMVIDAKKEAVRFCVGGREVVVRKVGDKLVFLSPTGFEDKVRTPKKKYTTKTDTSDKIHKISVTSSLSNVDTKLLTTPSSSVAATYTKTNTMKGVTPVLLTNAKSCPSSSVITLPFPFVSVPSTTANYLKVPINQQVLQRAPIIVNPMIVSPLKGSGLSDTKPIPSTKTQALLSQTVISASAKSETAVLGIPSTSDTSSLTRTSESTGSVVASFVASNIYCHPSKYSVVQAPAPSLVPVPGHVLFTPSVYSSSYLPVTNTVNISQANSAGLSMANGVGLPLTNSVGLQLAKSAGLPLAKTVSLSQANSVCLSLANSGGLSSASSVNFPLSNVDLTEMSSKGNHCVTGEVSSSASETLPKVLPVPVSQTRTTSTTAPSQTTALSGKGKFYLLKVDGKHILIPVPGSNMDAAMQTKAYLVNDLKAPVLSSLSKSVTSPFTPLSTQTVHVSSPATVKPNQPLASYSSNMPIMSYRVITSSSDVRSVTTASFTSKIVTSTAPSAPGSKVGRLVPAVLEPYTAPKVVTFSSASNSVSKSKDATIGTTSADPKKETSAKVSTAAYGYIFPTTKSLVSSIAAPVSSIGNAVQYSVVKNTSVNVSASTRVAQESAHKVKFITPFGKETGANGLDLTKFTKFEAAMGKEKSSENGPEPPKPIDEVTKPKPFSEVVTDREERLRKLKELLKQKNEAVDQLRLGRNSANTSIDGAEI